MRNYLVFELGGRKYGFELPAVVEIVVPQKVYRIPRSKPHVLGLCNIRGSILPVVDIAASLGERRQESIEQRYIWMRLGSDEAAVPVDRIVGVVKAEDGALKEPPTELVGNGAVSKVLMISEQVVLLLEPEALVR
ncbi:chemotaxis protein CheW [Coprothermobacteraceae bacterium]|nr:chemotaxis protein CheW [Coprothermobacteraceae bacterium]